MDDIFASEDLSKLSKQKGFDEECIGFYTNNYTDVMTSGGTVRVKPTHIYYKEHAAPTLQQLVDWLREKHGTMVVVDFNKNNIGPVYTASVYPKNKSNNISFTFDSGNYKEALIGAITETLKKL